MRKIKAVPESEAAPFDETAEEPVQRDVWVGPRRSTRLQTTGQNVKYMLLFEVILVYSILVSLAIIFIVT